MKLVNKESQVEGKIIDTYDKETETFINYSNIFEKGFENSEIFKDMCEDFKYKFEIVDLIKSYVEDNKGEFKKKRFDTRVFLIKLESFLDSKIENDLNNKFIFASTESEDEELTNNNLEKAITNSRNFNKKLSNLKQSPSKIIKKVILLIRLFHLK